MDLADQVVNSRYYLKRGAPSGPWSEDWEGASVSTGTRVILRFLKKPDTDYAPADLARFRNLARRWAAVEPGPLESVLEAGSHEGRTFLATVAAPERSLQEYGAAARLPVPEVLDLMLQVAKALERLHNRGLAHATLTPADIRLVPTPDGAQRVCLSGHYRAELRRFGPTGQPRQKERRFMAPELLRGGEAGPAADLYSLGAVFFWLLTGQAPSPRPDGARPAAGARYHPAIGSILQRLLHPDPGKRLASSAELQEELVRFNLGLAAPNLSSREDAGPVEEPDLTPPARSRPTRKSRRAPPRRKPGQPSRKRRRAPPPGKPPQPAGRKRATALPKVRRPRAGRQSELYLFKQLFYDLFLRKGGLVLIDRDHEPVLSEKDRIIDYFTYYIRYRRGLTLSLPPDWGGSTPLHFLSSLLAGLLRHWDAQRQPRKDALASSVRARLRPFQAPVVSLLPEFSRLLQLQRPPRNRQATYSLAYSLRIFLALLDAVLSVHSAMLVLLDGARSLDPASRQLLAAAADSLRDRPVLILGTVGKRV